jgi:hypothetical protein
VLGPFDQTFRRIQHRRLRLSVASQSPFLRRNVAVLATFLFHRLYQGNILISISGADFASFISIGNDKE